MWTLIKIPTGMLVKCNDITVVKYIFPVDCSEKFNNRIKTLVFSSDNDQGLSDTASDNYRTVPGGNDFILLFCILSMIQWGDWGQPEL